MSTNFGYRPDPTTGFDDAGNEVDLIAKDYDVKTLLPRLAPKAAGDVDLSSFATDSNQWSLSACAGNATADAVEIVNAIQEAKLAAQEGRAPRIFPQLSRLFVYSMARTLEGSLDKDDGTYLRLCFQSLSDMGICEEAIWPYDENMVFTSPSIKAQRRAVGHRIHSYYRIKSTGDERIAEIVAALRAHHPVVFGTQVDANFCAPSGPRGVVEPPSGNIKGGHAMIIVGYLDGNFKIKNSWGYGWGQGGYCTMSPDYIVWDETTDIWVPTLGVDFLNY